MKDHRTCLKCGQSFKSDGPWNRICPDCQFLNRSLSTSDRVVTPEALVSGHRRTDKPDVKTEDAQ